jgi:predicted SnoaL-like aldol condensation-catalyzing enzyme
VSDEEERNRRVVMRHFLEACGQKRFAVWNEIMHRDYLIHHPWCKPGRENYLASSKIYWAAVSPPQYEFLHVLAKDNLVMVHYVERGATLTPIFGEGTQGKSYEKKGFALYRLVDGLMCEGWNQEDDLGFMKQIGASGDYLL